MPSVQIDKVHSTRVTPVEDEVQIIKNLGTPVFYKEEPSVSATNKTGELTEGQELTIETQAGQWFIAKEAGALIEIKQAPPLGGEEITTGMIDKEAVTLPKLAASVKTKLEGTALITEPDNTGLGAGALITNTTGKSNTALGADALELSTGNFNTAIGAEALAVTTDKENTAIGYQALSKFTKSIVEGELVGEGENTAVGTLGMAALTTGEQNTGVGSAVMKVATTASFNTAMGQGSMEHLLTGRLNVGIGTGSLREATTGAENVAVGSNSLLAVTTQARNIAIGTNAMREAKTAKCIAIGYNTLKLATGEENTAVGYEAGVAVTTAAKNTALGFQALSHTKTGGENTGIGHASLTNALGEQNVGIGAFSLNALETAEENVAIGYGAGRENKTGKKNVYIGANAGKKHTGSNALYVANSETEEPLLLGNFETKVLTLNGALKGAWTAAVYGAKTARETGKEIEASATEPVYVSLTIKVKELTKTACQLIVGGIVVAEDSASAALTGSTKLSMSAPVPAGKKWELKVLEGTVEVLESSYLPL
jgi:hypothetical protein